MAETQRSREGLSALSWIPAGPELETAANQWIQDIDTVKWPIGLQSFENASYVTGNHLTRFFYTQDSGFGFHHFGLHDHSQYDNLVAKCADNKLIRPVENLQSMLTQHHSGGRVTPNSDLPEDEDAAELAEIVLDVMWEKPLNMPAKLREVAAQGAIVGTTAVEIEYGPSNVPIEIPKLKTRTVTDELTGEEFVEQFEDLEDVDVVWKDELQARIWNYFHLYPDPAATTPDELQWVIRQSWEDVDWVREHYDVSGDDRFFPENLEEIHTENATDSILYWWAKFQDIIPTPQYYQHGGGLTPQTFTTHGGYAPNQTLFTVIDVRPSRDFPRGRTIVLAGAKLIYAGDARAWSAEYPWRWHPYAFWGWFKLPGRFWHIPMMTQCVPLQKKLNAIDAQVHANRQFLSIGQWLIPKHSKFTEGMTSGIPGEGYKYQDVPGMNKPEKVPNIGLPPELLAEREQLERSIEFIAASGVGDPNLSGSALRSGVQIDQLRQQKLETKTAMIQEFEHMLETVCQNILIEIQLNLKEEDADLTERIQKAAREKSGMAVNAFTGTSLRDHHAVEIDIASRLLKSPEAREAKALEFLQYTGGQVTAAEREAIMRAIGMEELVENEENASVKYARRLLARIATGQIPPIPEDKIDTLLMPGVAKAAAMVPVFAKYLLSDRFHELEDEAKAFIISLYYVAQGLAQQELAHALQLQMAMAQGGGEQQAQAA